ncbi:MAG TPA: 6-phosphogluconolactonase [Candidatus Acidoferrales bacterium]|nr:6-phosphogluconolactonase [Candidatus Acidoferrales bacterium]
MKMDTRIYADIDALSRAAMDELVRIMLEAVAERGRFVLALSGGHTPAKMYALWAGEEKYHAQTMWDRVHLFWGDERYVPANDPLSNYRMTREALLSKAPIPAANVHRVPTDVSPPEKAAAEYDAEMHKFFGAAQPEFDLQLLGLGVEGHTASLFPGSAALEEKKAWVLAVTAPAEPPRRLTFTPLVLNCGRNTLFLVSGANKRDIIAALREEPASKPSKFPAGRIHPMGRVLWLLDQAAAS